MKPADYDPSLGEQHPGNDPTLWEYRFSCTIKIIRSSAKQGLKGGAEEFDAVVLIPDTLADQAVKFLSAWMPDQAYDEKGEVNGHEVGFTLNDPPYGFMRGRVQKRSQFHDGPHIFVMSVGIEEDIVALYKRSKTENRINVIAMPANLEHQLDAMKDSSVTREIVDIGIKT